MTTAAIELSSVQTARKAVLWIAVLALVALFAFTRATLSPLPREVIQIGGAAMLALCILGRAWCSLYIGGRKIKDLVREGPYSLCRNPLYTLSILGAFGAGAQSGSLTVAVIAGLITWAVFRVVVRREERTLLQVHGADYVDYLRSTPRFLPSPGQWRDCETLEVRPDRVAKTLLDGLSLLAFIPLAIGLAKLSESGLLPVLFYLP